jgi:hypothetical protein
MMRGSSCRKELVPAERVCHDSRYVAVQKQMNLHTSARNPFTIMILAFGICLAFYLQQ